MSALPSQPHPQDPTQPTTDPHGHRAALHDLIGMGTGIARLLHAQAIATADAPPVQPSAQSPSGPATPANPAPEPQTPAHPAPADLITIATAFDRIARAVRRCIALARILDAPAQPAKDPAHQRAAARRRILRAVEDAISRNLSAAGCATDNTDFDNTGFDNTGLDDDSLNDPTPSSPASDTPTAEALTAELHERLDGPDLDSDITSRPIADIVAELCRDLGIAPPAGPHPWLRRTPADIAALCARAAAPSPARPGRTRRTTRRPAPTRRCPSPSSSRCRPGPASTIPCRRKPPPAASVIIARGAAPCQSNQHPPPSAPASMARRNQPHARRNRLVPRLIEAP